MSIEEKVNVSDVTDIVTYYEALTDILRDFQNDNIGYDDANSQLMALNLRSDELGLGGMVSNSVLDPIQDVKDEESSYMDEDEQSY